MSVWEITVYDKEWHIISRDYKRCEDRQQAEIRAESDCAWLEGTKWEVRKIR